MELEQEILHPQRLHKVIMAAEETAPPEVRHIMVLVVVVEPQVLALMVQVVVAAVMVDQEQHLQFQGQALLTLVAAAVDVFQEELVALLLAVAAVVRQVQVVHLELPILVAVAAEHLVWQVMAATAALASSSSKSHLLITLRFHLV